MTLFAYWMSDGSRTASWHLRSSCNGGLATGSGIFIGIFTTGTQDPEIGVHMWIHQMTCQPDVVSILASGGLTWSCRTTCHYYNEVLKFQVQVTFDYKISLPSHVTQRREIILVQRWVYSHVVLENRCLSPPEYCGELFKSRSFDSFHVCKWRPCGRVPVGTVHLLVLSGISAVHSQPGYRTLV